MIVSKEIAAQLLEEMIPVHRFLGVKLLDIKDGYCKLLFPFREELLGNFLTRRWHGGIIATAMDSVGGAAAMTTLTSAEDKLATIDMRVDYLRGTSEVDLVVEGFLVRNGNRIIATSMKAWQEDEQKLVAEARGMYSVYRQKQN
ncbi:MAG: PaaI family thioesterase [Bacteroidota bacterium]